tara:strand:- start:74 stop:901 length:828 start_codon:yes stop_codon:yes gene_type:complete
MDNQFKKDFNSLGGEEYINSFLVEKGIRKAYLIQNFETTTVTVDKLICDIQTIFPTLKLFKQNNYYYLSIKQLKKEDVDNNVKIASLLRFDSDLDFDDLDREKDMIDYNVNVFLNDTNEPITIITYLCQTNSKKESAEKLVDDIIDILRSDINFKKLVLKVELQINVTVPIMSLVPKLMDNKYKFNDEEKKQLDDIIFNTWNEISSSKIIENINYDNTLHRGVMLVYISEYKYSILEPLYPLQSSGYMEEIYKIENKKSELMIQFLIDSNKTLCG